MRVYDITPIGKPRMTQRDKWQKRPPVLRYRAFCDEVRLNHVSLPESGYHVTFILPMPASWSRKRRAEMCGKEYKSLRRFFSVSVSVPFTDVWTHKPVQFYPGKHPCEKPADMLQQIINASSRPGDVVADFFMGSGSTIKAAMTLGRRAIGVELETERFIQTVEEIRELNKT